jgi:two-component system NtrC family sensor kinase
MSKPPTIYKEYVKARLAPVSKILPSFAAGDFSRRLKIPEKQDEFTELYIGINHLLDDLLKNLKKHEQVEEELKRYREHLRDLVDERTQELIELNEELHSEIGERKHAETALRESEEKFRLLFENASEGIIYLDNWGNILDVNPRALEIGNCTRKEIVGKNFMELFSLFNFDKDRLLSAFNDLLSGVDISNIDWIISNKKGEEQILRTRASQVIKEGEIIGLNVLIEDVTKQRKAERALSESEKKYRDFVERANDGVAIIQDSLVKFINNRGSEIIGYKSEDIIDTPFTEYVFSGELPKLMEMYKRRMAGEIIEVYETVLNHRDGHEVYVEINGGLIDYEGNPADLAIIRDVSERKKVKSELEKSERKYRNLVEQSLQGLVIIQGFPPEIVYANPAFAQITGYDIDELLNLQPEEVQGLVHSQYRSAVWKRIRDNLEGKSPPPRYELRIIRKDETVCQLEMYANRIDYHGEPAVQVGFVDITDSKLAEEALRESEAKYSALVENSKDGIIIIQDGELKFVNNSSETLTGFSFDEMIGENFLRFIAEDYRAMVTRRYRDRMAGKSVPNIYEISLNRKDGSTFPVELNASLIEYKGKPADIVFIRDITERKRTEEQLIHSAKLAGIGTLASGIAHEINNPLAGIMGYAEIISDEESVDVMKKYAKEIINNTERASHIVKWLSRYSRQVKSSDITEVNLLDVLDASLEAIKHSRKSENFEIIKDYNDIPVIMGNHSELQQVFMNILGNAMDSVDNDGKIQLTSSVDNGYIEIKVCDDGAGIPEDYLKRIFDPFFTTKDVGKGSGLGLYVTSMIVKRHSGKIDVESKPGKGTTFTVRFPYNQNQ